MSTPAYDIAVITRVPEPMQHFDTEGNLITVTVSAGNLACGAAWSVPLVGRDFDEDATMVFDPEKMILTPVFRLGEILFLDLGYEREVIGDGRKPDKWDVDYEYVSTLDEAIALSRKVTGHDEAAA